MLAYRHPYIAQEGWLFIGCLLILNLLLSYWLKNIWATPGWLLFVFSLVMYRDPNRVIPSLPLALVAPVDGKVSLIEKTVDPYIERQAWRIVITMNPFNVLSARSPTEGKVMNQWHGMKHENPNARESAKASRHRFAQWVQTDEGDNVVMSVQQRYAIPRSRCYVQSGERIGQGQRCGYLSLGAVVEVYIPENSRVDVEVGQRVRAGSQVIATLVHTPHSTMAETST